MHSSDLALAEQFLPSFHGSGAVSSTHDLSARPLLEWAAAFRDQAMDAYEVAHGNPSAGT